MNDKMVQLCTILSIMTLFQVTLVTVRIQFVTFQGRNPHNQYVHKSLKIHHIKSRYLIQTL